MTELAEACDRYGCLYLKRMTDATPNGGHEHVCCPCILNLIGGIEAGVLDGAIHGVFNSLPKDHPGARFGQSVVKRIKGAVRTRLRELLGVQPRRRYDPWHKHCATCECGRDVVQRSQRKVEGVTP